MFAFAGSDFRFEYLVYQFKDPAFLEYIFNVFVLMGFSILVAVHSYKKIKQKVSQIPDIKTEPVPPLPISPIVKFGLWFFGVIALLSFAVYIFGL